MKTVTRAVGRALLRRWSQTGRKLGWQYRVIDSWGHLLGEETPLLTTLVNGCQVRCDLGDHVQRLAYFLGAYEPVETYLFTRLLRPGMTVVDAGANFGQYTLFAAREIAPDGVVHSFEPVPATHALLQRNVMLNGLENVRMHQACLWSEEKTLELGLAQEMTDNIGAYSVGSVGDEGSVRSPAVALDETGATYGIKRIDALKMDIEGAELFALRGMRRLLVDSRPTILIEINRQACLRLGYSPDEIWSLLVGDMGYSAWAIGHSAITSGRIRSLAGIEQQNVIFHDGQLPNDVTSGWTARSLVSWTSGRF
jgi:FkbM family methyltransferase